jgi:hypothetical protein
MKRISLDEGVRHRGTETQRFERKAERTAGSTASQRDARDRHRTDARAAVEDVRFVHPSDPAAHAGLRSRPAVDLNSLRGSVALWLSDLPLVDVPEDLLIF